MKNTIASKYFSVEFCEYGGDAFVRVTPDWGYIKNIPEFKVLETTSQSPKWHSEGENVIDHVRLSVDAACKYFADRSRYGEFDETTIYIVMLAVLFHDIGKGVTTKLGDDGLYHNPNHAVEGERITRRLLWDLGYYKREYICKLVRYHMHPLEIVAKSDWLERMFDLAHRCGGLRELALVKMFDLMGSKPTVPGAVEKSYNDLTKFMYSAKALDIYDNKPVIGPKTNLNRFIDENTIKVYVMMGLPGAGKSTYVDQNFKGDDYVIVSRDLIRSELGYCAEGEKFIGDKEQEKCVTEVFNQKMLSAAAQNKTIVLDNMNNRREYRDGYKKLLNEYNISWRYIYCEAPTLTHNIVRRYGQIDGELFQGMINHFDMPMYEEFDRLSVIISKS